MKKPSSRQKALQHALILAGLLVLIFAPRPISGWLALQEAYRLAGQNDVLGASSAFRTAAERISWQPSLWERAGESALDGGDVKDSIVYFNKAAGAGALSRQGWVLLGKAYQQIGDIPSAVASLKNALPLAVAHEDLASIARSQGDLSAAMEDWRAAIALDANNANAHYQLGLLLTAIQPELALTELMRAGQLDPKLDPSVQSLRASLNTALLSDDRSYQFVLSGRGLGAMGEWDLAAEAFRRAIGARWGYADAWAWLGEAEQHLGVDGLADLQKAVSLDPNSAMIQDLVGIYWQRQGQLQNARAAYQKATELEPQNAVWQVALGSAYEQSGDLMAALEHYDHAVVLAPQDASAWRALVEFSVDNNVDIAGTGFPAAQKLLSLAPDDWQTHDLAGQATLALGNGSDAEQQFLRSIQIAPDQAAPHLHLGMFYLQTGDTAAAYAQLIQARTLDADGPSGWQAKRLLEQYFP